MPLTKAERDEINRAIKESLIRMTQYLEDIQGSPTDRAVASGIDYGGSRAIRGLERFVETDRDRRLRYGSDRVVDEIVGEVGMLATQPTHRKKRKTQFNKAVSEGMKIVKASKSYGKVKTINNPKKAFGAVTKAVSRANKGLKAPAKGVMKKVHTQALKVLKRSKKTGKTRRGALGRIF